MHIARGASRRFTKRAVVRWGAVPAAFALLVAVLSVPAAAASPGRPAPTPWPGGVWQPDPATYGMEVVSQTVTMDDGVTLYANVGYPTDPATGLRAAGKFPVLLTQNPYSPPFVNTYMPDPYFVTRGYIYASVTVRGTGDCTITPPATSPATCSLAAGGTLTPPNFGTLVNDVFGPREAQDGVEMTYWAAGRDNYNGLGPAYQGLDGSNGVVGLTGCSQLGDNQLFTAALIGPHSPINAILPACSGTNYDTYFSGGVPSVTGSLFGNPLVGPLLDGTAHVPENIAYGSALWQNILAGGSQAYDRQYWQERTTTPALVSQIVRNGIPALLWSGWNTSDHVGSLAMYAAFQNTWLGKPYYAPMSTHQRTTGRYQIVIGPWSHGAGLDDSIALEWYDTWLKGEHTDMTKTRTPMHLYQNNSGWVNASSWPITSTYTPYDLSGDGASGGALVAGGQGGHTASLTGSRSDTIAYGQPDQPGTTLSYTTPTFPNGTTLAGPITATIYASSNNKNLDLIVTLEDVAPDGTATQIVSSSLLGSMRAINRQQSWFDRNGVMIQPDQTFLGNNYVPAGQTARYDISIFSALWTVLPGHALKLVISTQEPAANCPPLSPPSLAALGSITTTAIPCYLTAPQQATLTPPQGPAGVYQIDHSRFLPSSLNLPIVANDYLPVAPSGTTPTAQLCITSSPPPTGAGCSSTNPSTGYLTEPLGWSSPRPGGSSW